MSNQQVYQALEKIRNKHPKGLLRPTDVVKAARAPSHPLHSKFTWDDGRAAELYRLEEARRLIRISVTVVASRGEPTHAYVSLTTHRNEDDGYHHLEAALTNRDLRYQLLSDAFAEMEIFQRKYQHLKELAEVFSAIEQARKNLKRKKVKA